MSGLSLRALGEALDEQVPHAALAKYEKGLMGPSSTVLIALGRALGVDNDYFFRSTAVSLSGIEFRKRTKCFDEVRAYRIQQWQEAGCSARVEAAWELVTDYWLGQKKMNPDELRLQKSVTHLRRRGS